MISIKITGNLSKEIEQKVAAARKKEMEKIADALAANTPIDTGEARKGWHIEGDSIVNRVEHISPLNHGSSDQAPAFFIEQTVLAHPGVNPNGVIVRTT